MAVSFYGRTPRPGGGAALSSSGHLGRGAKSRDDGRPLEAYSVPAHAIIAALSVHKAAGGTIRRACAFETTLSNVSAIFLLAATPPATTNTGL